MAQQFRPNARTILESRFQNLRTANWSINSPFDDSYKCITWAAGRTDVVWWPNEGEPQIYWPPEAGFDESIEAFIRAFRTIGYVPCESAEFEFGFQKVAIYADSGRQVKHMARQHFLGFGWLSKLGIWEDIIHADLQCIEGDPTPVAVALGSYGKVQQILRRDWLTAVRYGLVRSWLHALKFWLYRMTHRFEK